MRNGVQIDLIAHWYRPRYLRSMIERLAQGGVDTLLLEPQDKLPALVAIGRPVDARAPRLIAAIRRTASRHDMQIIPLIQTLAHAEHILLDPAWASRRESLDSPFQFCPTDRRIAPIMRRFIDATLAAFGQPSYLSLGGDEPWFGSLKPCVRCQAAIDNIGPGKIFTNYLKPLLEHTQTRGALPMIWGDYVAEHPSILKLLPRHVAIKYWHYTHHHKDQWIEKLKLIQEHGFETWAVPASRSAGDSPFLPDVRRHMNNVSSAIEAIHFVGAAGVINSAWALRMTPLETVMPLFYAGARKVADRRMNLMRGLEEYAHLFWAGRSAGFAAFYHQLCPVWPCFVHTGYYDRRADGGWDVPLSCETRLENFIRLKKSVRQVERAADICEAQTERSVAQLKRLRPATDLGQYEKEVWMTSLAMQQLRIQTTRLFLTVKTGGKLLPRKAQAHERQVDQLKNHIKSLLSRAMDEATVRWELQRRFEEEDVLANYLADSIPKRNPG